MNEFGYISWASVPRSVFESAFGEIRNYTVSFILNQNLIGSGTLVRIGDLSGILTGHHVSKLICKEKEASIGLNIAAHVHQFFVPVSHLEHLEIGPRKTGVPDEEGPDLALLKILDPNVIAVLERKKSFYRLDGKSFDAYRSFPFQEMIWAVAGSPNEWSQDLGADQNGDRVLKTTYFVGQADFDSLECRDGFDYIRVSLLSGQANFPTNYGGVSGGGIWLVPLETDPEAKDKEVRHGAPFLSGVAYCQSEPGGKEIKITGHGPDSVYCSVDRFVKWAHLGKTA